MKLFVVSDIHGYFLPLQAALNDAGFNEDDKDQLLISLGDQFDRGPDALKIYYYLKELEEKGKAIIIKGNHECMLENYLDGTVFSPFNYIHNGTNETLGDFLHETKPFETWCIFDNIESPTYADFAEWIKIARNEVNKEYPELLTWLRNLPFYYETKNYIFTHGAIDTTAENWRESQDWKHLIWDSGEFFEKDIDKIGKTVVIGHYGTDDLREMYNLQQGKKPYDILKRNDGKVIAIDTCTALTKRVNVLVLEDELLEDD